MPTKTASQAKRQTVYECMCCRIVASYNVCECENYRCMYCYKCVRHCQHGCSRCHSPVIASMREQRDMDTGIVEIREDLCGDCASGFWKATARHSDVLEFKSWRYGWESV